MLSEKDQTMPETKSISGLLLPELEAEFAITHRFLQALPENLHDYKPHDKSMKFGRLAVHVAEMPSFVAMTLTGPAHLDVHTLVEYKPPVFETAAGLTEAFDELAAQTIEILKSTADSTFMEPWKLTAGEYLIFEGTRYEGYRTVGVNQLVHHRAQLGVYLRLNGLPVPKTYGPSADEK
jgi:uncharacterized damage-inducible protein DinB